MPKQRDDRHTGTVRTGKSEIRPTSFLRRLQQNLPAVLLLVLIVVLLVDEQLGLHLFNFDLSNGTNATQTDPARYAGIYNATAPLVPFFTETVDYWEESIYHWSQEFRLNPNLIAILIQIESCGDPYVTSEAGAQGLFQVIPFYHFEDGENQLNPETNAQAGLRHMIDCLNWTADYGDEQIGLAFACYNGGPSVITTPRQNWFPESTYYYTWGTGIWEDASQGLQNSDVLNAWVQADNGVLCNRARTRQEQFDPIQDWATSIGR